jgi:hypothetical protein
MNIAENLAKTFTCAYCDNLFKVIETGGNYWIWRHESFTDCPLAFNNIFLSLSAVQDLLNSFKVIKGEWWTFKRLGSDSEVLFLVRKADLLETIYWLPGEIKDLRAVKYAIPEWVGPPTQLLVNAEITTLPQTAQELMENPRYGFITAVSALNSFLLMADSSILTMGKTYTVTRTTERGTQVRVDEDSSQVFFPMNKSEVQVNSPTWAR